MPSTFPQWLWFAFFVGGSLGGWWIMGLAAHDTYRKRRKR